MFKTPIISILLLAAAFRSTFGQQNQSNQSVITQPVQILYKAATALTCNLTVDSVADFDNVTFYRYSASDVNRTKPIRISPDGKMYDLNANTSSLIILAPKRTEIESTYFCNSTLVNQTIMFMFQVLPFLYIPDRVKISPTAITDVEMNCQLLFGLDPDSIQWRWQRNGIQVNATDRIQFSNVTTSTTCLSRLSIREITTDEGGLYECIVFNAFGSNNQSIEVNVKGQLSPLWPFLGVIGEIVVFVLALNFCPTPVKKYVSKVQ